MTYAAHSAPPPSLAAGLGALEGPDMDHTSLRGAWLTDAALENLAETGADTISVDADVQAIVSGNMTRDDLLAQCLDGADPNREQGWRDYVDAVCDAAAQVALEAVS